MHSIYLPSANNSEQVNESVLAAIFIGKDKLKIKITPSQGTIAKKIINIIIKIIKQSLSKSENYTAAMWQNRD